jgi:thiol:disulfide interchange protein
LIQIITIKKDPVWLIYLGLSLLIVGTLGFVPFKVAWWQNTAIVFYLVFLAGAFFLLRCFQKIGWRLSLKGNILYYQKFNLFSSWKKRRSSEFPLPVQKITFARVESGVFQIKYEPGRELRFKTKGINRSAKSKLKALIMAISA